MVAYSDLSSEPNHSAPAGPVGDFRLSAVRHAFGADDALRRMPSAWMISSLAASRDEGGSFQRLGRIAV
jgi:hypothetical protein